MTAPSTFTQLLNSETPFEFSVALRPQRTIRDGEPKTSTSTFTQLLSSVASCSMLLYVHRDHTNYCARGTQDGHLDELRGSVTAFKLIYFKCSFLSPIVKENLSFLCFVY